MSKQSFPKVKVICNYLSLIYNKFISYIFGQKLWNIIERSYVNVLKINLWLTFNPQVKSLAMNLIFRDVYSKTKYLHCFALIA